MIQAPPEDFRLADADIRAARECLESGWLTMGPRTQDFERAFADWSGMPAAVSTSSATAALHLALLAARVRPGDHVVLPAIAPPHVLAAVRLAGATASRADAADDGDPTLDPASALAALRPETRAVVVSHVLGLPARLDELAEGCRERGILLVEDATEALGLSSGGRKLGTTGDAGVFSLGRGSQIVVGDGGIVVSRDEELAGRVRLLRSHAMTTGTWDRHRGYAQTYDVVDIGFNYRLDELRAAIAASRLRTLDADLEGRRRLAGRLGDRLAGAGGVAVPPGVLAAGWAPGPGLPLVVDDAGARRRLVRSLDALGLALEPYCNEGDLAVARDLAGDPPTASGLIGRLAVVPFRGRLLAEAEAVLAELG